MSTKTQMSDVLSDERLLDMAFAMSLEFGWTPNYILLQMPMRFFNEYARRLEDYYIEKQAASEGKKSIPRKELTPQRKAEKRRKLKQCRASMQLEKPTTCKAPLDERH